MRFDSRVVLAALLACSAVPAVLQMRRALWSAAMLAIAANVPAIAAGVVGQKRSI